MLKKISKFNIDLKVTVCVSWWCVVLSNSFSYVYELLICHATLFSLPSFHVTKLKCPLTCPDAKLAKASYSLWIVMQNLLKHHTVYELWCNPDKEIRQLVNPVIFLDKRLSNFLVFRNQKISFRNTRNMHQLATNWYTKPYLQPSNYPIILACDYIWKGGATKP